MSEVFKPGIKKYSMPKTMNMHNRDQNNMTISRGSGKAQSKTTSGGDRMFKIGYRRTENPGLSTVKMSNEDDFFNIFNIFRYSHNWC